MLFFLRKVDDGTTDFNGRRQYQSLQNQYLTSHFLTTSNRVFEKRSDMRYRFLRKKRMYLQYYFVRVSKFILENTPRAKSYQSM